MSSEPTVFIVDDEPDIRDALKMLLGSVGLGAKAFKSAQDFIDACDPLCSGCLILDVRMPGMSGPELQEKLLTMGIELPIVFITGHKDAATAMRIMKAGAIDVMEKPFTDQMLIDRVQQALEIDTQRRGTRHR